MAAGSADSAAQKRARKPSNKAQQHQGAAKATRRSARTQANAEQQNLPRAPVVHSRKRSRDLGDHTSAERPSKRPQIHDPQTLAPLTAARKTQRGPTVVVGVTKSRSHTRPRKRPLQLPTTEQHRDSKPSQEALRQATEEALQTQSRELDEDVDPISCWAKTSRWPKDFAAQVTTQSDNMSHVLARKKSFRGQKRSGSSSVATASVAPGFATASVTTPSDQKPRDVKSAPYQDARYEILLATKGSFMDKSTLDLNGQSKIMCRTLLNSEQEVPQNSLFRDDIFETTCKNIRNRNEARVIKDISQLIIASAETLATYGAGHLGCLIETVNEGWNNAIAFLGTRPQPDYSVGFRREAFTNDQLAKLAPFIGDFLTGDQSFFMGTYYQYFPFLTGEVKCGAAALDVADRQNAHSSTLAVRAIVELFRLVGREMEVHQEILAFSISHDNKSVRIYGHYPVIDGKDTKYYRHPIYNFDFTTLDGKEKWTAYRFTKNVYDIWMPAHFKRICSAIDKIPQDLDFSVPELSQGGLAQELESHHLAESTGPGSLQEDPSSQLNANDAGHATPDTSFTSQGASKRAKKKRSAVG